jgi:hypothetical protein
MRHPPAARLTIAKAATFVEKISSTPRGTASATDVNLPEGGCKKFLPVKAILKEVFPPGVGWCAATVSRERSATEEFD